jgi:CheY-like chemotaxis protein
MGPKQSRHVLIVDDNALNGELLSQLFNRLGWKPVFVHSGDDALKLLLDRSFDLLLLDLRMPDVDGETVCRSLRARCPGSTMPIVAFTAHRMREEKARLLELGFTDLLVKPPSMGDVVDLCNRLSFEG